MAEPTDPGQPLWWVRRLYGQLLARRPVLVKAAQYYDGVHNLAFQSKKFKESFGGLFKEFADNWCAVVVGACEERLNVTGFRVDELDPAADRDAWKIWQSNDLDLQAQMAHTEALSMGAAYVTTWYSDDDTTPEITVDSAIGTIVETHPKLRRRRLAALRTWIDQVGYEHAELFLPDTVYAFRSTEKRQGESLASNAEQSQWVVDPDNDDADQADGSIANPLGVVPVVELLNKPRLFVPKMAGFGVHSELAGVIPLQDAANKLIADMLLSSEFAAFPQRYATGYEDENGDAAQKFKSGPGNFWWIESEQGNFGQFQVADLGNYVKAIEMIVQHVASISATPPHYLRASADRLSGESLKSAETGLMAKCRRRIAAFSESWEESLRLGGRIAGNERLANAESMETIWGDPESRTEAEHTDAALKKVALGIPLPQIWEDLGYSPQQIQRFKAMQAQDALLAVPPSPGANGAAAPAGAAEVGGPGVHIRPPTVRA